MLELWTHFSARLLCTFSPLCLNVYTILICTRMLIQSKCFVALRLFCGQRWSFHWNCLVKHAYALTIQQHVSPTNCFQRTCSWHIIIRCTNEWHFSCSGMISDSICFSWIAANIASSKCFEFWYRECWIYLIDCHSTLIDWYISRLDNCE